MRRWRTDRLTRPLLIAIVGLAVLQYQPPVHASPYGQGVFGANVPFGSLTSLAISLGSNVTVGLAPSGPNFEGSGSHTITVTSSDVVGYNLYIYSPNSTDMTNGSNIIPASANGAPAPLSPNSWGYNTDGSSNYKGVTTIPVLLKSADGPYMLGDTTTVKYGVLTDITTGAGAYTIHVTYTAVARTD